MSINKAIANLPRTDSSGGSKPSDNNFVAEALADKWYEHYLANGEDQLGLAIPEAGPYRGSYASKRCDRALWYALRDEPLSDPHTVADAWTFGLGSKVHEMLQEILTELFPDAEAEALVDLRAIGIPGSSHVDLVFTYKGKKTVVEVKSTNGFSFKMIATSFHGAPQGPRSGAVIQGALAAKALGAEQLVIAYLSLEKVSPNLASAYSSSEAGRFAAEWHYSINELDDLIDTEIERIKQVVKESKSDTPPPRRLIDIGVPANAKITDPASGMWVALESPGSKTIVDTGSDWQCNYCNHRSKCIEDGA